MSSFRRRLMMAQEGGGSVEGVPSAEAVAGDVCMYGISEGKLIIVNDWSASKYPIDKYPPVGVVVVPGSHGHYEGGKCAIMSLVIMDCEIPQHGNDEVNTSSIMNWGDSNIDISQVTNFNKIAYVGIEENVEANIIGLAVDGCLASEKYNYVKNPYDIKTGYRYRDAGYYYAPSPYNNDGTFNVEYSRITSPSSSANCLSDFDGYNNTKKIIEFRGMRDYSVWKPIYSNVSDYPAASCCDMYFTQGTNQGDWYLPSAGELVYYCARCKDIESKLSQLKLSGIPAWETNSYIGLWTSTEIKNSNAWAIWMLDHNIRSFKKDDDVTILTRAFLQV